jgi:hypothetical protein
MPHLVFLVSGGRTTEQHKWYDRQGSSTSQSA